MGTGSAASRKVRHDAGLSSEHYSPTRSARRSLDGRGVYQRHRLLIQTKHASLHCLLCSQRWTVAKSPGGRRPFGEKKRLRRSITPDQEAWALATELAAEDKSSVSQLFDRLVDAEAARRDALDKELPWKVGP